MNYLPSGLYYSLLPPSNQHLINFHDSNNNFRLSAWDPKDPCPVFLQNLSYLKGNPRRRAELLLGNHVVASSLNEQQLPGSDFIDLAMEKTASPTLDSTIHDKPDRLRCKTTNDSAGKLEPNGLTPRWIIAASSAKVWIVVSVRKSWDPCHTLACKHAAATMMRAPLFAHLRMTKWRIPIYRDAKC